MKRSNPNSNAGAFLIFLIFLILISVTVGLALSLRVNAVDENLKSDRVIKTLVVMEDKNRVLFTDVFIYYPETKRGALINILGNTGAIYSSLGRVDSIDSVYLEKGIEVYKSEIEKLVGQAIPFYIVLNLTKFGELTDLLGGMKILNHSSVDVRNEEGERWLLPNGLVSLDGDKIQAYLNYERPDDKEDDVIERRQNVLLAFFSALSRNEKIIQDKKSFALISKKMSSNLDDDDFHRLMMLISQVDSERLSPQTITGSERVVDGKKLLFPHYNGELIKQIFQQMANTLISLEGANNRTYVLSILNGTSVQGLARNTGVLLQSAGYNVLSMGNADSNDYEKTTIINHIGNAEIAKILGDFIRCKNIIEESVSQDADNMNASNVDFTIILGKDFDGRYVKN